MDEEQLLKIIGPRVKKRRAELGLTQEALAKRIDSKKERGTISDWENARVKNPTLKNICAMAGALELEVWDLIAPVQDGGGGEGEPPAAAILELEQLLMGAGAKVRPEELKFLESVRIKGSPLRDRESYLLLWLILRWVADKRLSDFFELELSGAGGDITGKFTIHLE